MSKTVAVYPIISALSKAFAIGSALTPWQAVNREQQRYLEFYSKWEKELSNFSAEELESIGSFSAEEINNFLASKGFDIRLGDFSDPDDFGTASVMKVLVKWISPGEKTWLLKLDTEERFRAVKLEDDVFFTRNGPYTNYVAHVCTESGDTVHMTVASDPFLEGLDLLAKVQSLTEGDRIFDFDGVVFPMVDHNAEVDISFFQEMFFKGKRRSGSIDLCKVKEAKQQTKFAMNHLGAKAESAAAFAMSFECCAANPKPPLVINDTFWVWMTRKGMSVPYFAGCIDSSDWKDPGDLK